MRIWARCGRGIQIDLRLVIGGEPAAVPLKGDAGRTGRIGPQNLDVRSYCAGGTLRLYERTLTHRQAVTRTVVAGALQQIRFP